MVKNWLIILGSLKLSKAFIDNVEQDRAQENSLLRRMTYSTKFRLNEWRWRTNHRDFCFQQLRSIERRVLSFGVVLTSLQYAIRCLLRDASNIERAKTRSRWNFVSYVVSDPPGIFRFEIFGLAFAFDQTKIRWSPIRVFYVKHAANRGYSKKNARFEQLVFLGHTKD